MLTTLCTGGSGYLGGLIVAALLADRPRPLVLPVRATDTHEARLARLRSALLDRGLSEELASERLRLVTIVELPDSGSLRDLESALRGREIDELIHCAGCLDYWDKRMLRAVNVELTRELVHLARGLDVTRVIYISTAYCSGYLDGLVPERLHEDPAPHNEPTEYTRTKRMAEWLVAESGLPFAILRPSIVVGDSRTGRYTGKNYGLYQMWRAIEGLLCREYAPIWYTVAPHARLNFVHQDAFQEVFLAVHRMAPDRDVWHVVSDSALSPTMRDLCWLWADVYRPAEIHCYERVDDVPLRAIPTRQRRFLELAAKNLEISARGWRFETAKLDGLRSSGLPLADATLESIARCQQRYIEGSTRIQEYIGRHSSRAAERPRLIECPGHESPARHHVSSA